MHDHDHDHAHDHDPGHAHRPLDYVDQVGEQRAGKDAYFRESAHSPIPVSERPEFAGLAYYGINQELRFTPLSLGPIAHDLHVDTQVQTSDGAIRSGQRVGAFTFSVGGVEQRLTALRLAGSAGNSLFVPFTDATSGPETYGAGRYLDLEPSADGTYDLDFNFAYAPFCAYSPQYSCPLPPAENRLSVAITAGERNG